MNKLYKKILIFLFPLFLLLILVPVNKRLRYIGLKDDCFNHAIWIYDRIFNNNKPVDIAFLGSSHTVNGINDKLIENELKEYETDVVNFGYCRLGRNLSYTLLKTVIKEKKPKIIIIEVLGDEPKYSHPVFPHISATGDVIFANIFFNRDFIKDIYIHLSYKIQILQDDIYGFSSDVPIKKSSFGFASSNDTASAELLDKYKIKRNIPNMKIKGFQRNFHMKFPRTYLKKINKLCLENDIILFFLYIPSFGDNIYILKEYETYIRFGEVLIPPKYILNNKSSWHDQDHLNQTGAKKLSLWIVEEIKNKLNFSN